jgi:hypothetical protein
MISRSLHRLAPILGLVLLPGCVLWARDPDFFEQQLSELLEEHSEPIEACYDRFLEQQDPQASGELVVAFEVERKTGALTKIEVERKRSTVPEGLAACVTDELATLTFEPVDVNTAQATYTWAFTRGPQKHPPPDPFAGAQDAVLDCYRAHLREVDREATGVLVIDYAFDEARGEVERLEVIEDGTTAPQPVVECATQVLAAAKVEPDQLEARNLAGRRTFSLRFTPYTEGEG